MASERSRLGEAAGATEPLHASLRSLQGLADGFGRAMTTAFKRSVVDGRQLGDVLRSLARDLSARGLNAALAPIGKGIGGLLSGLLGGGRVMPFAKGGAVATPQSLSSALGVAGAGAGLTRQAGQAARTGMGSGLQGGLGLRTNHGLNPGTGPGSGESIPASDRAGSPGSGRGLNVTFNVQARDAESFRRAEAEVTAMLARAVARGQRGM